MAVRGAVQGVGFRPFVYRLAMDMRLPGWVVNSAQGVLIEVEGAERKLREFLRRLQSEKPTISFIQSLEAWYLDPTGFDRFEIRESSSGEKTALIMPDVATCADCQREVNDPADRRYRYPFTNCTNCGPRFTIIESLPYDRPHTTMRGFTMCPACEREYHDPNNRRFHAQPNACPECGPHLELWDASGTPVGQRDHALRRASEAVRAGGIVAAKGLGGFHLICDARNDATVRALRLRKRREEKPFALMYPSLDAILEDCECSEIERSLLLSLESPIVLLRRKSGESSLSPSIAPGNPYLGAMLPYTPLHHLLMRELGFPVIATSGNLSEEPICTDEREALTRLKGMADLFLVHNRPILRHVDDSIVREIGGRELVLRRARGFAPLPVELQSESPAIVAVGPHQKNTVACSVGKQVFISQHIGDLETAESMRAFRDVNTAFRDLYELKPSAVAFDMHPDYLSSQYARTQPERLIEVQHHHAHVLACMAENRLRGPVLGLSWDGSGFGLDGTVWGGEFLRVDQYGFQRLAHLRTFPLPGGEKAVKEPRRVAIALLYEIFGDEIFSMNLPPLRAFTNAELHVLMGMLEKRVHSPLTSSMGRLFDGVAALLGVRQVCGFEGQAAMELEYAATGIADSEAYPFEVRAQSAVMHLDWEPTIRAVVASSESPPLIARRFHVTLADAAVTVAKRVGEAKVVLSGGCFQNRVLTELVIRRMRQAGFEPYWHQRVPPNDGGISLGQIVAAAQQLEREKKTNHVPSGSRQDS